MFFENERLYDVPNSNVVISFDANAALIALRDFFGVVFESLERRDFPTVNDNFVI